MRKLIIYIFILILISFLIPILFTNKFGDSKQTFSKIENIDNKNENSSNINESSYDYKKYNTVKVLHTKTGSVENLNLDEYLYGVVSAEMPASFEKEALKAQSIVARTYTIYKIIHNAGKHQEADICDDSGCCQAWISKEDRLNKWDEKERKSNWNKIVSAVKETKGKIITYNGEPINAFFHSNSGGSTEAPINVWGGSGYPYLQTVQTSGEEAYTQYKSEVNMQKQELIDKIKSKYQDFSINFEEENAIQILEYTKGNRVKTIKIGNKNLSGVEVRSIFGLKSANFEVEIDGDNIIFSVIGYGHGVGMSQTGADSLAKQGKNCEEIITHFYIGVEIIDL
ncbi:MAG TPA: stage II sporulation protein D [Clostridiaceae bacterium]|nr:stage II sporulation protein D [Clostridiaceae bacterium]